VSYPITALAAYRAWESIEDDNKGKYSGEPVHRDHKTLSTKHSGQSRIAAHSMHDGCISHRRTLLPKANVAMATSEGSIREQV
jgi:hypothetical protein